MAVETSQMSTISLIQDFVRKSSKPLRILRKCPGCQEPCRTKLELYVHTSKCRKDAFVCRVEGCPFACLHAQHLRYHAKLHSGTKEIKCDKCQYTCSTITMLKSHTRTHEGIMRFRCYDCPFSTKQPSHLSQHLSSTGHLAAPVLNEDGTVPEDEHQKDFRNHIRPKKRMAYSDNDLQLRAERIQPDPYNFQMPVIEIAPIVSEDNKNDCFDYLRADDSIILIENDVFECSDVKDQKVDLSRHEILTYKSVLKINLAN